MKIYEFKYRCKQIFRMERFKQIMQLKDLFTNKEKVAECCRALNSATLVQISYDGAVCS